MYLDANFFMFLWFDEGKKGIKAREILQEIVKGKHAMTSALAIDETMWVILKNKHETFLRQVI